VQAFVAIELVHKQTVVRTTVDIDATLLQRMRDEAHRRGVSFKDLHNAVLARGLTERAATKPVSYRCPSFAMAPTIAAGLDRALGVAAELEDEEIAREMRLRK
jgi:hypothetical protein